MNIKNFFRHKKLVNFIRIILAAILVILAAILLYDIKNISLDTLLSHTPKNPYIAAIILLLLYAAKSITVFVPLIALQLIAGSMFSPFFALMINFIGIIICYTIPYLIGKRLETATRARFLKNIQSLKGSFTRTDVEYFPRHFCYAVLVFFRGIWSAHILEHFQNHI